MRKLLLLKYFDNFHIVFDFSIVTVILIIVYHYGESSVILIVCKITLVFL